MSDNNSLTISMQDAKDLMFRTRDEAVEVVIRLMEERDKAKETACQIQEQLHAVLDAAKKLEARGFFAASTCADKATNADMAAMLKAMQRAEGGTA